jgi:signal peptidase I
VPVGLAALALIGGAALVLLTSRSFTDPSTSMANTIRPGERLFVDRTAQVHRGDVIIEREPPVGPGYYVRRVIGLPGDHVACCDARGRMTVNGKPLTESYLYPVCIQGMPHRDAVSTSPCHRESSGCWGITEASLTIRRLPAHSLCKLSAACFVSYGPAALFRCTPHRRSLPAAWRRPTRACPRRRSEWPSSCSGFWHCLRPS